MILALILSALAVVTFAETARAANKSLKTRVGSRTDYDLSGEKVSRQRFYLRQEASSLAYRKSTGLSFFSNFYLAADTEPYAPADGERYTIRADALYAEYQKSFFRMTAGMQQITWGETFGIPVVDVVNPIDVTEPFSSDTSAAKIAVFLTTAEIIAGNFYVQGIFNPLQRRSPLPQSMDGVPIRDLPAPRFGEDVEYGGRLGYLFPWGLDVKTLYYRHYNRIPRLVGRVEGASNTPVLLTTESLQHSFGLSASQAFDEIVLRTDVLYERDTLEQVRGPVALPRSRLTDRVQGALGIDWTASSGDMVGAQIQAAQLLPLEDASSFPEGNGSSASAQGTPVTGDDRPVDTWGGLRLGFNAFNEALGLDLFGLHGLGNRDWWLRPQITLRLGPRVEWISEANIMSADPAGRSDIFARRRLINSSLSYRF